MCVYLFIYIYPFIYNKQYINVQVGVNEGETNSSYCKLMREDFVIGQERKFNVKTITKLTFTTLWK